MTSRGTGRRGGGERKQSLEAGEIVQSVEHLLHGRAWICGPSIEDGVETGRSCGIINHPVNLKMLAGGSMRDLVSK